MQVFYITPEPPKKLEKTEVEIKADASGNEDDDKDGEEVDPTAL